MNVFLNPNKLARKFRNKMWDCSDILVNTKSFEVIIYYIITIYETIIF